MASVLIACKPMAFELFTITRENLGIEKMHHTPILILSRLRYQVFKCVRKTGEVPPGVKLIEKTQKKDSNVIDIKIHHGSDPNKRNK